MDNLARIISHGFAVVVVVLLGIGFIYRGELFPDLELPDFLVPESGKTVDNEVTPGKIQPDTSATRETSQGETIEKVAPAPVPEQSTITHEPGIEADVPEVAPPGGMTSGGEPVPPEAAHTATVIQQPAVETPQAPAAESNAPVVEEPVTEEGIGTEDRESSGDVIPESVPSAVPSGEPPVEPSVEVPVPETGTQDGSVSQETSPEPGMPTESGPQDDSQAPGMEVEPSTTGIPPEEAAPGSGLPVPESAPVTAPVPQIQPAAGGADHAAEQSAAEAKPYELLAAAREAFWLHNYDDAEKNYRALTELEPKNPDGYGELGNMYFSQGRWDEAAAAYYEAGTRLVSEGRLDSARELVKVIRGLNGKQADELDKLIGTAAPNGNN